MSAAVPLRPAAAQDVDHLLYAALRVGSDILRSEQASRPFGVLLDLDGVVRVRGATRTPGRSDDAIAAAIAAAVFADADLLLAAVIVEHTGDEIMPTMRGYGDHRLGIEFAFFVDWLTTAEGGPRTVRRELRPSLGSLFR